MEKARGQEVPSLDSVDEIIAVTSSAGWLQLAAVALIILAVLAWSAATDVPVKVKAKGMLLGSEGVAEVMTSSRGRLVELDIDAGDTVGEGDLIAVLAQPDLENQLALREAQLRDAQGREDALLKFAQRSAEARGGSAVSRVRTAEQRIALLGDRETSLRQRDANLRDLEQKGLAAKDVVLRNRAELASVSEQIAAAQHEIAAAQNELKLQDAQSDRELAGIRQEIIRITAEIDQQRQLLVTSREVRSPYSGRVIEVKHRQGEVVESGAPIVLLDRAGANGETEGHLVAIAFAPPENGKEIQAGMTVNLAPAGVRSNEYGFIRGKVIGIADAPATSAGMMRVLKNDTLVRQLLQNGAPFQVEIEMERAETASGFAWTSSNGPNRAVGSGTPCDADVIVRRTRLLGLIVPPLARFFAS